MRNVIMVYVFTVAFLLALTGCGHEEQTYSAGGPKAKLLPGSSNTAQADSEESSDNGTTATDSDSPAPTPSSTPKGCGHGKASQHNPHCR